MCNICALSGGNANTFDESCPVYALDGGVSRGDNVITVYFVENGPANAVPFETISSDGWSDFEKERFMAALAVISEYVDLTFVATNDPNADMQLVLDDDELREPGLLGYFYLPTFQGDTGPTMGVFNADGFGWDAQGLEAGGLGFSTIIHEVLHGLGLEHPHDGDNVMRGVTSDFGDFGDFGLNQGIYTIMSYNDGVSDRPATDNTGNAATPMALDIAILQEFYGANTTHNNGNNVYDISDDNEVWAAIWDTGGTDTIRYDGDEDTVIDLREATLQYGVGGGGFISAVDGVAGGFTIANGAVIENAIGGSGDDMLMGNGADNALTGNDGNDIAKGGAGNDVVSGGDDNDALYGDSGNDSVGASGGVNTIYGGSGFDNLTGGSSRDTIFGGSGDDVIDGGGGTDTIFGGRGDDDIDGGSGSDTIAGGLGADTLTGGGGADTFVFTALSDSTARDTDTITDFQQGLDVIDLSAIDADTNIDGNQALTFAGQVTLDSTAAGTTIFVDRNDDGTAEMEIFVQNVTLTESDFTL